MSTIQIVFLALAILATLYQAFTLASITGAVAKYGTVRVTVPLRLALLLTVAIQVVFVLTLTGDIA